MKDELPHPAIKHVVVLMLEGRAFDHLMGWLYAADEQPAIHTRAGDKRQFLGLSTLSPAQLNNLGNPRPDGGGLVRPMRGARSPRTPAWAPGDGFVHVMRQTWGVTGSEQDWKSPDTRRALVQDLGQAADATLQAPMSGYVLDYALAAQPAGTPETEQQVPRGAAASFDATEILDTYTPEQLPVLSGLARHHAVCDEWYSSVPGPATANRAFAVAGTSRGLVDNGFYGMRASGGHAAGPGPGTSTDALPVSTRSLFEVLQQFGFSWKVYGPAADDGTGSPAPLRTLLPLLGGKCFDTHFVPFDAVDARNELFESARTGHLPAVSWIEPRWGDGSSKGTHPLRAPGHGMRPASDTTLAEDFVASLYTALSAGPAWPDTLLVITFDTGGGTYDHLPPPQAIPSGNDRVPLPQPRIGDSDMDPNTRTQFGFDFAQYGVRVPTLLVSPRVPRGTVFRSRTGVPFDHGSLIASILTLANVGKRHWQMGKRVSRAPTFLHMLTSGEPAPGAATSGEALNAAPRPPAAALQYNREYRFEYSSAPRPEGAGENPVRPYLGAGAQASIGSTLYFRPTLTTDVDQAVRFKLVPESGSSEVSPVLNMALVRLVTTEPIAPGFNLLCTGKAAPCVYYSRNADDGTKWQVRILSSRDPRQEVRVGDRVFFVSRMPLSHQEPLQRLLPHPDDARYLGTCAGAWALWTVHEADSR